MILHIHLEDGKHSNITLVKVSHPVQLPLETTTNSCVLLSRMSGCPGQMFAAFSNAVVQNN